MYLCMCIMIKVFWYVTQWGLVDQCRRFGEAGLLSSIESHTEAVKNLWGPRPVFITGPQGTEHLTACGCFRCFII
jgi:hypothetical protein